MSAELRECYMNPKSQIQARLLNGQSGHPVPEKSCQNQGYKPSIFSKGKANLTQGHGFNNYLKRHIKQNLRPAKSEQHLRKSHRKEVQTQWEESQLTEDVEQRREQKPRTNIKCKEGSMQWEERVQGDQEEQDSILEQGDELGCGEELAQGNGLDWQVGLEEIKGFNLTEGQDLLKLLSDSCSKAEEEIQGVKSQLHMEEEGKEVGVNGNKRSHVTHVDSRLPSKYSFHKQIVHKDGIKQNKTQTAVMLSDKTYAHEMLTDQKMLNGFYQNSSYINGLNTDDLTPERTDIISMFPELCDAGEALADADGFLDCDLFEHIEPSWKSGVEDVGDCGDTGMLPVEEDSENSSGSLSTFVEEGSDMVEEQDQKDQVKNLSFCRHSHSDPTVYSKPEREAELLSEVSDQCFTSFCSPESEVTSDEMEKYETRQNQEKSQDGSETVQAVPYELASVPPIVSMQPEEQKSQQVEEEHFVGQEGEKTDILCGQSFLAKMLEEHVYEETEPNFQTKDFLQSRKYFMTRSISVETPRLDPLNPTISGKGRLMLHPQSYYTRHNYLGDSLPALTGSLGCLSPGGPCPPAVEIPPPFELSSITRRPIRKSTPALPSDVTACNRKLDFGLKRYFLPLRFLRKTERRTDSRSVSSRSSSESSPQGSCRRLNLIRQCTESPELHRAHDSSVLSSPASLRLHKKMPRQGISTPVNNNFGSTSPNSWDMSDDLLNSLFVQPFPLSKPRSFSSPNVDSSIYENILNTNPHYENVQVRLLSPSNQNQRNQSSANDTDGYVDMSSLPGFQSISPANEQETESAYTICSPMVRSDGSVSVSVGLVSTKEEEKKASERLTVNCSRVFYLVKELLDSETQHVKTLQLLNETLGADEQMIKLWSDFPAICSFHQDLHTQLESRIKEWDQKEGIADILLAKKEEFSVFFSFISQHDSKVRTMEQMENTQLDISVLKQQLLQVIVRVLQYRMLLTDYKNNFSQLSREYEDTQAALVMVSDIADKAKACLKNGADVLRLVNIEHSVQGLKNLLQPGRVFVKEGTLMKVSRKCKQPRHLFLMSDIMLYTYPQQDGKYRLINTLALTGMEVTRHLVENTENALKIEVKDISITLLASSSIERDDWFVTLNRTVSDLGSLLIEPSGCFEVVEKSGVCLGDNAPPLVSVSQVAVCMNCPVHFSLTHRRHHCHACGKVVCRDCCRNKVPLKYMKNRRAKVCNKCYSELCKNGDAAVLVESSSRPLSTVFQNIHPTSLWKSRKGHLSFNQTTGSEGEMSGTLQRSRNSKRSWRSLWFLLKDKVLYTYPQPEERVACESLPLLGFSVKSENEGESSVFQLYHHTTLYYTFRAQDTHTAQRWVSAMEEATVL
ncbi:FYVE, RhoGEF and PH domain-containing protein 5b isoform 1-T1 [Clarias gariepinus]